MKRRSPPHPGKPAPAPKAPAHARVIPVPGTDAIAPDESLEEAESEIGINEWIDPETGEPAEGQSPPHLQDE
jgi:hypothetical protein